MSFAGKIVVITGAAGIYGRQFSKAFGREGATLVLTDCKAAGLNALARELALPGERLRLLPADLADDAAISSGAAHVLRINGLAYCVSKRGLDWLVKGMALELARWGIRVNAVEPGLAVGSTQASFPPGYVENMSARIPLGRMAGEHEAADAILFLCSDKASYITGAAIPVDGGSAIPRRALSPTTKKETT